MPFPSSDFRSSAGAPQLRLDAGLSQQELAQRAGMTQPTLSRLEQGGTVPTLTVLDRIANALQATLTITLTRAA